MSLAYGPAGAAPAPVGTSAGGQSASVPDGLARIRKSDCLACHGVDNASLGPSYVSVAQKYQSQPDARMKLITKIATGGTGVWGDRVMPPHPSLSEDDRRAMVDYILSLASSKLPARGRAPLSQHAATPGGTYRLTAIYADQPRNGIGPLADTAVVVLRAPRILASTRRSRRGTSASARAGRGRHVASARDGLRRHGAPLTRPARSHGRRARDARAPLHRRSTRSRSSSATASRPARSSAAPRCDRRGAAVVHADDSDLGDGRAGGVRRAQTPAGDRAVQSDGDDRRGAVREVTERGTAGTG